MNGPHISGAALRTVYSDNISVADSDLSRNSNINNRLCSTASLLADQYLYAFPASNKNLLKHLTSSDRNTQTNPITWELGAELTLFQSIRACGRTTSVSSKHRNPKYSRRNLRLREGGCLIKLIVKLYT